MRDATPPNALLKALATDAPFGLAFWTRTSNENFEPSWWNNAFLELFSVDANNLPSVDMNHERDGLKTDSWHIKIHPDDTHILQTNWQGLLRGKPSAPMQVRVRRHPPPDRSQ